MAWFFFVLQLALLWWEADAFFRPAASGGLRAHPTRVAYLAVSGRRRYVENTPRSTAEGDSAAHSVLSGATASGCLPSSPARTPRLYLGGSNLYVGQIIQLTTEQTRYLVSVMRLRDGSLVRVFDGVNGEFLAAVVGKGGRSVTGRARRSGVGGAQIVELQVDCLTRRQPRQDEGTPRVELMFAPIRKQRLKMLVEKAVEIGASRLTPVLTARTQKGAVLDSKALDKLGFVTAVEAAEQCERMTVPCVGVAPVPLLSLLRDLELQLSTKASTSGGVGGGGKTDGERARLLPGTIFVCKERDADAPPILEALAEYARDMEGFDRIPSADGSSSGEITQKGEAAFLVGPEGGFDPDEISALAVSPFVRFVSLGPSVLRAETAAVYAMSSWSAFWAARR